MSLPSILSRKNASGAVMGQNSIMNAVTTHTRRDPMYRECLEHTACGKISPVERREGHDAQSIAGWEADSCSVMIRWQLLLRCG